MCVANGVPEPIVLPPTAQPPPPNPQIWYPTAQPPPPNPQIGYPVFPIVRPPPVPRPPPFYPPFPGFPIIYFDPIDGQNKTIEGETGFNPEPTVD